MRDAILTTALALLEEGGLQGVTMRALARRLGVDPMAPYHYFPDKDALLRAAAARAYEGLRVSSRGDWRARLRSLARSYVRLLGTRAELLRYVTTAEHAAGAEGPRRAFDRHFDAAIAELRASRARRDLARDVFVDFLHGYALAGVEQPRRLAAELDIVLTGIAAHVARGARRR